MENSYKLFLLAVEEMNFTKAAKKAFVTQQCLSNHIKKLEAELNIRIFERSPRLALTPAGEVFYETVRQIELLEENLTDRISEIRDGCRGEITFGINATRARILLPDIFEEYNALYPNVKLSVILDDTNNLGEKMLNKNLDLFLGISCAPNPCFEIIPVNHDYIYFIATASFLKKWQKDNLPEKQLNVGEVLDLHDFPNLPLAGGLGISTVNQLVKRYLESQNICPNQGFAVSDYETQISLCGKGLVAVFCPQFILERVIDYNKRSEKKDEILPFRLKEMSEYIRIDIIKPKQLYTPKYMECFIDILKKHMTAKYHTMNTNYNSMGNTYDLFYENSKKQ